VAAAARRGALTGLLGGWQVTGMRDTDKLTVAAGVATMLASLALYPIVSGPSWFWTSSAGVIVVGLTGTLTRKRTLPPLVCLAAEIVGLLLWLNLRFEASRSLLVIPTPGSISALWDLAGQGLDASKGLAPPVAPTPPMLLLVAGGVGFTAVLVDLIAVRLRSAAIAGLPLLMIFTEPFAVDVTRSATGTAIVFCLAAAGYLALLSTDGRQRVRTWGRVAGSAQFAPDTTALASTSRRVGLMSVVVALCIPLLVPGLHATRLLSGVWTFAGSGNGSVSLPSPITSLSSQLAESRQTVLTYTSSNPDGATQYLQEYVLGQLTDNGFTWVPSPRTYAVDPGLPAPAGLDRATTPTSTERTTIKFSSVLTSASVNFLPMPYPARTLNASGTWSADPGTLMVLGPEKLAGLSYEVTSLNVAPTASELSHAAAPPASIKSQYASVPGGYASLLPLAESITKSAHTELAKAQALESYLSTTGGYTYTLQAPPVTDAATLTTFLEQNKRGYCEQFAYAMTVLARLLGIPARLTIGYTAGQHQSNGSWVVRSSDAHAWPELYFSGVGWIRFEPTPVGPDGQGTATSPSYAIAPTSGGSTGNSSGSHVTTPSQPTAGASPGSANVHLHVRDSGGDSGQVAITAHRSSGNPWPLAGLAVLALIALSLILPSLLKVVARVVRWHSATGPAEVADAAWRQFRADLADYRIAVKPSESPRALAARVVEELGLPAITANAIQRLALAAERARYSASPASPDGLRADTVLARRAIAAVVGRRARLRAWLAPMSVLGPAATLTSRSLDSGARLGRWRPRSRPHPSES
jgi:transglutaminase-like putative cysteine protease